MFKTLKNAWSIPELRKKLMFTLLILLAYRIGNVIPVPYIDTHTLSEYFNSVLSSTILGLYNAMSGSAFSIFSLADSEKAAALTVIFLVRVPLDSTFRP